MHTYAPHCYFFHYEIFLYTFTIISFTSSLHCINRHLYSLDGEEIQTHKIKFGEILIFSIPLTIRLKKKCVLQKFCICLVILSSENSNRHLFSVSLISKIIYYTDTNYAVYNLFNKKFQTIDSLVRQFMVLNNCMRNYCQKCIIMQGSPCFFFGNLLFPVRVSESDCKLDKNYIICHTPHTLNI